MLPIRTSIACSSSRLLHALISALSRSDFDRDYKFPQRRFVLNPRQANYMRCAQFGGEGGGAGRPIDRCQNKSKRHLPAGESAIGRHRNVRAGTYLECVHIGEYTYGVSKLHISDSHPPSAPFFCCGAWTVVEAGKRRRRRVTPRLEGGGGPYK